VERRIELSEKLRALARELTTAAELAKALERAADALQRDDAEARTLLNALAAELERLEDAIVNAPPAANEWIPQAGVKPSERRELVGKADALVETEVRGRNAEAVDSAGIVYTPRSTGVADGEAVHTPAVRAAAEQIDSGRIPPQYVELVKKYFDSIKPSAE